MSGLFRTKDGIPMRVMTVKEFCAEIGISKNTLKKMADQPRTFNVCAGQAKRHERITREEAIKWVEDKMQQSDDREGK